MKITSLTLHNFGIYEGTHTLDFSSEKTIILIGGMNGRGKTTLLEAILLAFYDKRSFAYIESKISFRNYLDRLVNKKDGTLKAYVEMDFTVSFGADYCSYSVKREWSSHVNPTLKTAVYINGIYEDNISQNWSMFIEEMLPSAIAPFFFFDGEKVSELANAEHDTHIKNSIKNLLGIDIIDQSIEDMRKIVASKKRVLKSDTFSEKITEYDHLIKNAENEAKEAIFQVGQLKVTYERVSKRLQTAENDFSKMGGHLASQREKLLVQQAIASEKLHEIDNELIDEASGDLPLLLVIPLLKTILNSSEGEREAKAISIALEKLHKLFKGYSKGNSNGLNFDAFIQYIHDEESKFDPIYNLSENGFMQLRILYSTVLNNSLKNVMGLLEKKEKLVDEQNSLANYLSVSVDGPASQNKHREILGLTSELATISEKLRVAQETATSKQAGHQELVRQQYKLLEKAASSIEGSVDTKRTITYALYSINVLEVYKVRVQKAKVEALARTMTQCFKSIVSKQNLISEIVIDPITLDFLYLDSNKTTIPRTSFSAGERQLLVISMLWALGTCSKTQLPVIIDTPLARLDSMHREALIKNYFPKASEQTILLSTDSEIHGQYYDLIRPYIGKEYTLVYDDENKHTKIHEGYFRGA